MRPILKLTLSLSHALCALLLAAPPLAAQETAAPLPDLTPLGMVRAAHPVVQGVMGLLALATLICWTVLVYKGVELALIRRRTRRTGQRLLAAGSLPEAAMQVQGARDPAARLVGLALEEMNRSAPVIEHAGPEGVKERVASVLRQGEAVALARLRRGTGLLATIGAVGPFVGLFGTVWGIMNAFVGISQSGSTNLAVVAPGIAEALLATALGLVAAIPAVVIFNALTRSIAGYRQVLAEAAAGVERLVSRDLDFRRCPRAGATRLAAAASAVGA